MMNLFHAYFMSSCMTYYSYVCSNYALCLRKHTLENLLKERSDYPA